MENLSTFQSERRFAIIIYKTANGGNMSTDQRVLPNCETAQITWMSGLWRRLCSKWAGGYIEQWEHLGATLKMRGTESCKCGITKVPEMLCET